MSIKIKVSERNTNKHTPEGMEILENSINKVGVIESISTTEDDVIISGHARHEIFNKRGMRAVEVILNDDEYAVLKTKIKSNTKEYFEAQLLANTTAHKNFNLDMDMVESIVEEFDLIPEEVGVELLDGEIELEAQEDDFDTTPPEIPFTVLGDLYEIGEHRLLCGDSTDSDQVAKLMDGKKAQLLITDLPYGVSYGDKNKFLNNLDKGNSNQTEIKNDHIKPNELYDFAKNIYTSVLPFLDNISSYYAFMPQGGEQMMMMMALNDSGFKVKHELIWLKNNHVLGRSDYNYKHEPICYGWTQKGTHKFYSGFKTSILEFNKPNSSIEHPTMKPIELLVELLTNSSIINSIILDPTIGSGSTMVAAHQLKRKCYGMELDCRYADVIVKRMLNLDKTLKIKKNGIDETDKWLKLIE